eukprot:7209814-Alexandrium_andersonii.AAC.1
MSSSSTARGRLVVAAGALVACLLAGALSDKACPVGVDQIAGHDAAHLVLQEPDDVFAAVPAFD